METKSEDLSPVRVGGISFSKPFAIEEWEPPREAALYLIMRMDDGRIAYVGESGNLDDRGFLKGHDKYKRWLRVAGAEKNLAIAFHPMPGSTQNRRKELESNLFRKLHPPCSDAPRVLGAFWKRMGETGPRVDQQTHQLIDAGPFEVNLCNRFSLEQAVEAH